MTRLPQRPDLEWKEDGTPVASAFDDIYFSRSDGLEETRAVFFQACGLPDRWKTRESFCIGELGFGTGLNFLALVELWLASEKTDTAWLDFMTVEKHPMRSADAAQALSRWPDLAPLAAELVANWPEQTAGLQRIIFPDWRVSLTVFIGDAGDWLSSTDFKADAWFLDGFAPSKNDAMWSDDVLNGLGAHAASGCLVGTYTVAGHVRRGLQAAGFEVSKQPGFGRKRERLEAIWPDNSSPERGEADIYLSRTGAPDFEKVVIIGAGIAGASLARSFAERGKSVTLIDGADGPASGASGNPYGLVMPRLDAADTPQARFLIQSYLYALKFYARFAPHTFHEVTVHQRPQSDAETLRFSKLLDDPPLNADWLEDGSETGLTALFHKGAFLISPARLVEALTHHSKITCKYGEKVQSVSDLKAEYGELTLFIISSGADQLTVDLGLPLAGKQGQIEYVCGMERVERPAAEASGFYALRLDDELVFGATFEPIELSAKAQISDEARTHNLTEAQKLSPGWIAHIDPAKLESRASTRVTTPDRMPIAGALFDEDVMENLLSPLRNGARVTGECPEVSSVFVMTGLGARGFTFAPLLADLIVSQTMGSPLPLARSEQEIVSPVRFLIRAMRKGQR